MRAPTTIAVRALVAGSVLAASACGSDEADGATAARSSATAATVVEGPVAATALVAGDCLTDIAVGAAERAEVASARKVSCHSEHTLEVYATFTVGPEDFDEPPGSGYPGAARVVRAADRGCERRFQGLVEDPEDYGIIAVWPSEASWATGDRTVACAVYSALGELFQVPQIV